VAKLMVDAGLIVLVSFISPVPRRAADGARAVGAGEFIEVFVDTPLAVAESARPQGPLRQGARGELKNFTGIDSPYEPPKPYPNA
jgi:bifunctional enzyme CysN/CysC